MPLSLMLAAAALLQAPLSGHVLCERGISPLRFPDEAARLRVEAAATPATAATHFAQGCLAFGEQKWDLATAAFERAVKVMPGNAAHHLWLGRAYAEQATRANRLRQATLAGRIRNAFTRAVELDPDYLDARAALAQFYVQAPGIMGGSATRADEQVEEIRRRNAYLGGLQAANLAQRRARPDEAERELRSLISTYPDSLAPYSSLVNTYVRAQRYDDAMTIADRFRRASPDVMIGHYIVGRIAAEGGIELDRGVRAVEQYLTHTPLENEPSIAHAHWRLGMIREKQGDRAAARAAYEESLRLNPEITGAKEGLERVR
ncbi:MAG TPA: tetratricopeptide repeat protein [Gemmatimonadaceae bacterium]|nr:tetratricopeptide repeat protein [Gemmatimonadaceae bacterium]